MANFNIATPLLYILRVRKRNFSSRAGYKKLRLNPIKGKRSVKVTSLVKTEAAPEDIYTVSIPALNPNQCIVPDTLALSFKFSNSNAKSWFLNNLGRLLVDRLSVFVQGVEVYQNSGESMLEVYKDLWRSEDDRKRRQEYGLANENVRKLISGDDSGDKTTETDGILDKTVAGMFDRMKIPLGKILNDHGPYAPYGMFDFEYRITLAKSEKILKAQTSQTKGNYKLTDLHLEYEVIESEDLAREVRDKYMVGRSLGYDYTTLLKTLSWDKDSTRQVIDVNIPRKSLKAIVLLFSKAGEDDSEYYPFPNLTNVNVTVEGIPNDLYSDGLKKRDMYAEAKRFFDNGLDTSFVSLEKLYNNKFACVVDFRTVDDKKVSGSGRKLIGTQVGLLLEIEKEATTANLSCHVFVVADGLMNVVQNKFQKLEY